MNVELREEYCELKGGGGDGDGKWWRTDVSVELRVSGLLACNVVTLCVRDGLNVLECGKCGLRQ